jgi:hypothetical protein
MKTVIKPTLTVLFVILLNIGHTFADGARNQLSVAPQKVYPKMIEAVESQDWEKLSNALKLLQPLSEEIDRTLQASLTTELKQAIADKNAEAAKKKVLEFIIGGIRSLLILSGKEDTPDIRKEMFRQAFTEYITVEPFLKKIDSTSSEKIMSDFKKSYNSIQDKQQFIIDANLISRQLKTVATKI